MQNPQNSLFKLLLSMQIRFYFLSVGQTLREHWSWVLVAVVMLLNTIDFSMVRQTLVPLIFRDSAPLSGAGVLLLVHLIGVVWVLLQRRAITDPRSSRYIQSLPIPPAVVARVQLVVMILANSVIWLYFASQFTALWERDLGRWDFANATLFVLTVAACLLLTQAMALQRRWLTAAAAFGASLLALHLHNTLAGPAELLAAGTLLFGLLAALLCTHKIQLPATALDSHSRFGANHLWRVVAALLPAPAAIRLRIILLSGPPQAVVRLGLIATCVTGLTAVPLRGAAEPAAYVLLVESYLCAVISSGFLKPLKTETEQHWHYLSSLPLTRWTIAWQDMTFLMAMLLMSTMPSAILFWVLGRISAGEIALISGAASVLLCMHKLVLDYAGKHRVAGLLLASVTWISIAYWVILARS